MQATSELTAGQEVTDLHFANIDFEDRELADLNVTDSSFINCNFRRADLSGSRFVNCEFNDQASEAPADFTRANLREVRFERCNLTVVSFVACKAYDLELVNCQLQGCDFATADFRLPVGDSDLVGLTIKDSNLSFANFSNTYLVGCIINDSRMLECVLNYCNLSNADLMGTQLHGITAQGMTLNGADLRGAEFSGLDPRILDLTGIKIYQSQALTILDALEIETDIDP